MAGDKEVKNISILGSTGSIGTQTLEVAKACGMPIIAISGNKNITLLEQQIREFKPKFAAVFDQESGKNLRIAVADTNTKILSGSEGLNAVATADTTDMLVTSIVGSAGLLPTLAAIDAGIDIALANKETLVTAGEIVMGRARAKNVAILPVDSEHSAIFQSMQCGQKNELKKIILTASGGTFYGKTKRELENVTVSDALKHPNWSMGNKITIDSGTLMNKGLEVIEAHFLFDVDYENIEVLIHRESIVHSMVQFCDNSIVGQMGVPSMKLPIHYALHYPKRSPSIVEAVDLAKIGKLTFSAPDYETFTPLKLAIKAGKMGGTAPTAVNAANEIAVAKFLQGRIKFTQIGEIIEKVLYMHKNIENPTIDEILDVDLTVRNVAEKL